MDRRGGFQRRQAFAAIKDTGIAATVAATGDVTTPWGRTVGSRRYAESGYQTGIFAP